MQFEFSITQWVINALPNRKQAFKKKAQADKTKNRACIVGYDHQTGGRWLVVKKAPDEGLHMLHSDNEKTSSHVMSLP